MKKILIALLVLTCLTVSAQKNPDWEFKTEGKAVAIFNHDFTGIPIAETTTHYYGINYVDKKPLWTIEKNALTSALNSAAKVASMTGRDIGISEVSRFNEIPFTPFVEIENKLIDVTSGHILIGDGENGYSEILDNNILAELYVLLLKVKADDGSKVLYCIDLNNKRVSWKTKLSEPNKLKEASEMVTISSFQVFSSFAPKITNNKDIVYKNDKILFLINSEDGTIKWQNECNPGTFFLDPKQENLIVVKQASSLGNAASMSTSSFSKNILAIDINTGKELWEKPVKLNERFTSQLNFDNNSFIVAHKKGINILDYKSGAAKWKKDFETKKVQEMTISKDGITVFYGNKIMLVDVETGKKAWKKPIKFDDIPEDDEGNIIKKSYDASAFIVGSSYVGLFDSKTGKKIWVMSISDEAKVAFDDKNSKVAIIDKKKFYLFNPLEVSKKPQKIKLDIEEPHELVGFETYDNGYFVTGMNEFIALNKKGVVVNHQYYKPLKTNRLLKAALNASMYTTAVLSSNYTMTDTETGEVVAEGGVFMSRDGAKAMGEISDAQYEILRKLKKESQLKSAVRSTKNFAYFLNGVHEDGQDNMSVVKIDKNTGKEVDSFNFGNNRKVIYEINKLSSKLYLLEDGTLKAFEL